MTAPSRCRHDLVLFGSEAELIHVVAPFVAEGVDAGDRVLVHADPDRLGALRDAVAGPGVEFAGGGYATPIATLVAYQQLCDAENAAGRAVRAVAPIPAGASPTVRAEWMRYEALVARALSPYRFSALCLYDTRTTPRDLVERARLTHRYSRNTTGLQPNVDARPDPEVLRDIDAAHPLPRPPMGASTVLAVDLPADAPAAMSTARGAVRETLRGGGLPDEPADGYSAAIGEVLANALVHGRGPVRIRLLTGEDGWWCTVSDRGPGIGDPYAGIDSPLPGNPDSPGAGLWVARQLCDQLTIDEVPNGGVSVVLHHRT